MKSKRCDWCGNDPLYAKYHDDEFDDDDNTFDEFDSEGDNTIACPYCSAEIYYDVEICSHCRNFIIEEDVLNENRSSYPAWVIWTAIILLVLILSGFTCLL